MADYCSIQNSRKYQTLLEMSGISRSLLLNTCDEYLELFGRFPELDELPNVNSTDYLKKEFDLKTSRSGTSYLSTDLVLEITGKDTIEEANAEINDSHKDLEVSITDIDGVSIFEIELRPNEYNIKSNPYQVNATSNLLKLVGLINALDKMRRLYGIKIIPITSLDDFPKELNVSLSKAFIYNGDIYVNTDLASVDSPIHELMHILMGSMSRNNPQLFYKLTQSVELLLSYTDRALYYQNRTRSDVNEEIFVEEISKYLTGQSSLINSLEDNTVSLILYYILRDLDTILNGNYSVKSIDDVFNSSLMELAEMAESNTFNVSNSGFLNDATVHRMLANTKEELIKKGDLTENCE